MKIKIITILISCLLFLSFVSAQDYSQTCTISLFPENENKLAEYLAGKNISTNENIILSFNVDKTVIENCLKYLNTKINITFNNLQNIDTTHTADGHFYIPQTVEICSDGTYSIMAVPDNGFRLAYDPAHPDSIKEGKNKGYVKYPNINKELETKKLYDTINLYNIFADIYMDRFSDCYTEKESFDSYMFLFLAK
jgi:flagellar basal body rod protein FlgC